MKKLLFGISLILFNTPVLAQTNVLFPELQGQFKVTQPVEQPQPIVSEEPTDIPKGKIDLFVSDFKDNEEPIFEEFNLFEDNPLSATDNSTNNIASTNSETQDISEQSEDENTTEETGDEGNLQIEIQNVNAVLPYARNMSYCGADFVLTNKTNQTLDVLTLEVSYNGNANSLTFNGVKKKAKQERPFFMIGPECTAMDALPQYEVKECKMGKLSLEACQKRVQLVPLNQ